MKHRLLIFILILTTSQLAFALPKAAIRSGSPNSWRVVQVSQPSGYSTPMEMPPWILNYTPNNGWASVLFNSAWTIGCNFPTAGSNLAYNIPFVAGSGYQCAQTLGAQVANPGQPQPGSRAGLWNLAYEGAFSGHLFNFYSATPYAYSVNHAENKNQIFPDGRTTQNSFNFVTPQACASQVIGPSYRECLSAYYAFVTLSAIPFAPSYSYGATSYIDYGPIVWPANGYAKYATGIASDPDVYNVVRHPTSIVRQDAGVNYLYVFYVDQSSGAVTAGRGPGIKVARAPVNGVNAIDASSFKTYYQGQFNEKALPAGYSPSQLVSLVQQGIHAPGGRSSDITGRPGWVFNRLSVAKLKNTAYYISVSLEAQPGGGGGATDCRTGAPLPAGHNNWFFNLRLSQNLVEWGPAVSIPGITNCTLQEDGYSDLVPGMDYPVFISLDGRSNVEVDAGGFSILGTSGNLLYGVNLGIQIVP